MKKSFVFAALFAFASIGLVFVGCNNGGGAAPVVPPSGGTLAEYAATYSGTWSYNGSSGTSGFTLDATAGTITGTKSSGSDLSISNVTVSGGGALVSGGVTAGKWTYVYSGTTKIGIAGMIASAAYTQLYLYLGKSGCTSLVSTLSNTNYNVSSIDTSDISTTYTATGTYTKFK